MLRTDHSEQRWLQFKNPEGQLVRWIERLQASALNTEEA